MAATFNVSVVTPEREVLAGAARFVALPAYDGEMGILAKRAPLVVQLGSGRLRVDLEIILPAEGSLRFSQVNPASGLYQRSSSPTIHKVEPAPQ